MLQDAAEKEKEAMLWLNAEEEETMPWCVGKEEAMPGHTAKEVILPYITEEARPLLQRLAREIICGQTS